MAKQMSDRVTSESRQWQTYLSALAVQSFEQWLSDRLPNQRVERDEIGTVSYLKIREFKLCIIAVEHCLDEVVSIPQDALALAKRSVRRRRSRRVGKPSKMIASLFERRRLSISSHIMLSVYDICLMASLCSKPVTAYR